MHLGTAATIAALVSLVLGSAQDARAQAGGCRGNPDALGVAKTVEIDTTGAPGFGFEHYKAHDFLLPKEVVLTFDDGPWPTTKAVLAALAAQCTKAIFFPIGKHALYYPEILKEVASQGHTIGTHTWSHANLGKMSVEKAKEEIEMGVSAVRRAVGGPTAPFFRFPYLKDSKETVAHLAQRNLAIFSTDIDSFDFKIRAPDQLLKSLMAKLEKKDKGILLLHDFQAGTAAAIPNILAELKSKGYKVVHMKPKSEVRTLAQYDTMVTESKEAKGLGAAGGGTDRPTTSVVRTIESAPAAAPAAAPGPQSTPTPKK